MSRQPEYLNPEYHVTKVTYQASRVWTETGLAADGSHQAWLEASHHQPGGRHHPPLAGQTPSPLTGPQGPPRPRGAGTARLSLGRRPTTEAQRARGDLADGWPPPPLAGQSPGDCGPKSPRGSCGSEAPGSSAEPERLRGGLRCLPLRAPFLAATFRNHSSVFCRRFAD